MISTRGSLKVAKEGSKPLHQSTVNDTLPFVPFKFYITLPLPNGKKSPKFQVDLGTPDFPSVYEWYDLKGPKFDFELNYFKSIASMYVATVKCGIDKDMLTTHENTPIGSILMYHIALTYQLMYDHPNHLRNTLNAADIEYIEKNIPSREPQWDQMVIKTRSNPDKWILDNVPMNEWLGYRKKIMFRSNAYDYRKMIQRVSHGITRFGLERITDSMITMMYNILLAQGKTGFPIASKDKIGMVSVTQSEFKRLHKTRVYSGRLFCMVLDLKLAMNLIKYNTSEWFDVCMGFVRVPTTLMLFKTRLHKDGLVTESISETVVDVNPTVDLDVDSDSDSDSEDSDSDSEDSDSEDSTMEVGPTSTHYLS